MKISHWESIPPKLAQVIYWRQIFEKDLEREAFGDHVCYYVLIPITKDRKEGTATFRRTD